MSRRKSNSGKRNTTGNSNGNSAKRVPNSTQKEGANDKTTNKGSETETTSSTSAESKEGKGEEGNSDTRGRRPSSANDPEWYSNNPLLVKDTCTWPFSRPFGGRIDGFKAVSAGTAMAVDISTPIHGESGILTFHNKPCYGYNNDIHSPLNVSAQALYTQVRVLNSGRKNYDPVDLELYVAAIADLYSYIVWLQRLYGYAFMYSQRNFYVGKELLRTNNVDTSDIVTNLANFNAWINMFISKVSAWVIPSVLSIMKRRAFMYGSLYIENPEGNIKDQLYQFVPDFFYRFALDTNTQLGMLECVRISSVIGSNPWKVSDLEQLGEYLIANIYGDEDFAIISGDILKAFQGEIVGLAPVPNDYFVVPAYDEYVLSQMHNASIVGAAAGAVNDSSKAVFTGPDGNSYAYGNVYQTANGILVSRECAYIKDNNGPGSRDYLNVFRDPTVDIKHSEPDENMVMEATRLMTAWAGTSGSSLDPTYVAKDIFTGSDMIIKVNIDKSVWSVNSNLVTYSEQVLTCNMVAFDVLYVLPPADYMPLIWATKNDGTNVYKIIELYLASNISNFTTCTHDQLRRIHEVALMSLMFVPTIMKAIN